ncbi:hypothetical protein COF80_22655 [Bacillus toyonensis]|uniref:hypothetical protein n=1 Tax=Bacillus toyonensis TaxID=155322 RepID=UPI000BFD40B6|nr:hypothetical protein [Bacillus toyonensis]PHE83681.1 hypothetical protein COF80_22655 [Bacillus toyonensis]
MKTIKDEYIKQQFNQETFDIEMRKTLEKFVSVAMNKGLSKEEAFRLIDVAMDLVTEGRGNEWIDIAQDAIHKASDENK